MIPPRGTFRKQQTDSSGRADQVRRARACVRRCASRLGWRWCCPGPHGDADDGDQVSGFLGMALHRAGRLEQALEMYDGALASVRGVGPANTVQYALAGAGHVTLLLGDADRAGQLFAGSHAVARRLGAEGDPRAAVGEGLLARERGAAATARERLTFAQQLLAGGARAGVDRRRCGRPGPPRRGRR
ncbi:hypothetical protein SAMN04488107_0420 [Geodermatophilus saharensis]|uniref:Tetratricopeptide repeat-containing protein n=1 Tax=Geodermatophilus saharensis TaxID=1137994 RepID=A0A238ZYD7_9ACTN|nr:hypothetical protein SAMN04488107_0420 [Geodermatophilus saharensis]